MSIVIAMGIFFIVVTMVFVAIAVFLPEWMGITGNKAKKIIAEQQEDSSNPPHE
ncbi:hypothetical protein [Bdellovibrio sp. BCCA]|uniref:hypothetical protein n=1 Tax=Bdellovibrio sp. BCCA TaxID=3136281 RepID=UPI0030F2C687